MKKIYMLVVQDVLRRSLDNKDVSRIATYSCIARLKSNNSVREILGNDLTNRLANVFKVNQMGFGTGPSGEAIFIYPDGSTIPVNEYLEHANVIP